MSLDNQQSAAVHTDARRALVLAGAGSGKTRVLVERIAHLIEDRQASAYEILAFTFTRKAAGEMRSRLEARLGPKSHRISTRTMHSLALNMVHRFGELIGLRPQNITVYSEWESDFLLKEVATDVGVYRKGKWKIPKRDVDGCFNAFYQRGVPPPAGHCCHELFDAFIARCRENNALTYGALLIALRFLVPELAEHLHVRYVLVDEVQDIDPLQWNIINALVSIFDAELFVVGDIDQSIYEWRGAVPDYLVKNQDAFTIYRIESNYRSSAGIVLAANRLIENNSMRLAKTMLPTLASSDDIMIRREVDSAAIVQLISDPVPLQVTVLARNHILLQKLSGLLEAAKVPHLYVGKRAALTGSEAFRRVHAFLKLLVNPYDNFSFLLVRDRLGIDDSFYADIRSDAAQNGRGHYQSWISSDLAQETRFCKSFFQGDVEDSLFSAASELQRLIASSALDDVFGFIYGWLSENPSPTWEGENPIRRYLDWLALYEVQDEIRDEAPPGIQLMTIHAAKGLEFDTVLVAGCNEGILPSSQSMKDDRSLEAERRLAYVAWTRARNLLVLGVRPTITETEGKVYQSPVSRFIGESFAGLEADNG